MSKMIDELLGVNIAGNVLDTVMSLSEREKSALRESINRFLADIDRLPKRYNLYLETYPIELYHINKIRDLIFWRVRYGGGHQHWSSVYVANYEV